MKGDGGGEGLEGLEGSDEWIMVFVLSSSANYATQQEERVRESKRR